MIKTKIKFGIIGLLILAFATTGCLIVAGTFVIVEDFDLTAETGFYYYKVDITDEPEWKDHEDEIDFVDAVGLEFDMNNTTGTTVIFNVFITPNDTNYTNEDPPTEVPTGATVIIQDYKVPAGKSTMSYAQSLSILKNVPTLKKAVKSGVFDYYGTSTANDGSEFVITKGKVIATMSASSK